MIAGLDWPHAFRRSGHQNIPRVKRVELRRVLDQLAAIIDQIFRVRFLPNLAVYSNAEIEVVGVVDFIRRGNPWPQNSIRIQRFSEAAVFDATDGIVQADRISRNDIQRIVIGDVLGGFPDNQRQFDFMIISAIGVTKRNSFARPDEGGVRL